MKASFSLRFDEWPQSHRDIFTLVTDIDGPPDVAIAGHWSSDMNRSVRFAWGLWLKFVAQQGGEIECAPGATIVRLLLAGYIGELLARVNYTTATTYLRHLGEALRVMDPAAVEARSLVRSAEADLGRASDPSKCSVPANGESEIYRVVVGRMEELWPTALTDWRDALSYLDALSIAIGMFTSARTRTLGLTTKAHAKLVEDAEKFYRLSYAPHEVKTGKELVRSMPPELTKYIEQGQEVAASLYERRGAPSNDNFWMSRKGTPMRASWLVKRMARASEELVGERLTPQRFRRLAATSINRHAPREMPTAREALQHHRLTETYDHYVAKGSGGADEEHFRLMEQKIWGKHRVHRFTTEQSGDDDGGNSGVDGV